MAAINAQNAGEGGDRFFQQVQPLSQINGGGQVGNLGEHLVISAQMIAFSNQS